MIAIIQERGGGGHLGFSQNLLKVSASYLGVNVFSGLVYSDRGNANINFYSLTSEFLLSISTDHITAVETNEASHSINVFQITRIYSIDSIIWVFCSSYSVRLPCASIKKGCVELGYEIGIVISDTSCKASVLSLCLSKQ